MLRRIRRSSVGRVVATVTAAALVWLAGPSQAAAAAQAETLAHPEKRHARKLDRHELKAIRGRQIGGGGSATVTGGPAQPWGFSYPDLGGYGQIGTGNQFIS